MTTTDESPITFPGTYPESGLGCTLCSDFQVEPSQMESVRRVCDELVATTAEETRCLYYSVGFCGNVGYVRGDYADGLALLRHIDNVGDFAGSMSQMTASLRLEVHGPETELEMLREPLAALKPRFFTVQDGFRR